VPGKGAQEQRHRFVPNQKQRDKTGDLKTKKKNVGQRHFFHRKGQRTNESSYDKAPPATSEVRG
jgi:hypothetical protein